MGKRGLKPIQDSSRQQWARGLLLLCVALCGGAPEAAWGCSSPKAEKPVSATDLEKELKQYKTVSSVEARFEQVKKMKDAGIDLKSSGDFRMRAEAGVPAVDWTVRKPAFLQLHITEDRLELSEEEGKPGKPAVENKDAQARILRSIYAWLSMNSGKITEQFNVTRCGPFILKPKDTDSPIERIMLWLGKDGLVKNIGLSEKSGDRIEISFLDTKVTKSTAGAGGSKTESPAK